MEPLLAVPNIEPYITCTGCVVKEWCGRRSGKVALPKDYRLNPECSGYIMLERAIELSKIPKEYRMASQSIYNFDPYNESQRDVVEYLLTNPIEMVDKGINVAMLNFNMGTGKTYTACAIANEFIYKTCMTDRFDFETPLVLYVKFGDWCNDIRRAHQEHKPEAYEKMYNNIDIMKKVPLLILDDIGSGRITDIIRDLTYDVIDKRKEDQLSTIFTSNMVDTMLKQEDALGGKIVSRIMYKTTSVNLGGRDRRQ